MPAHRVTLGVAGGIAAYKAAELARTLMDRDCSVQVVMTRAAEEFVRPLTFAALTGNKVITNLFSATGASEETLSSAIEHIRVAQESDVLVVAPATADILAKMRAGLADDLATTALLATDKPVMVAPAMNVRMWEHRATQDNLRVLAERGVLRARRLLRGLERTPGPVLGVRADVGEVHEEGAVRRRAPALEIGAIGAAVRIGQRERARRTQCSPRPRRQVVQVALRADIDQQPCVELAVLASAKSFCLLSKTNWCFSSWKA